MFAFVAYFNFFFLFVLFLFVSLFCFSDLLLDTGIYSILPDISIDIKQF